MKSGGSQCIQICGQLPDRRPADQNARSGADRTGCTSTDQCPGVYPDGHESQVLAVVQTNPVSCCESSNSVQCAEPEHGIGPVKLSVERHTAPSWIRTGRVLRQPRGPGKTVAAGTEPVFRSIDAPRKRCRNARNSPSTSTLCHPSEDGICPSHSRAISLRNAASRRPRPVRLLRRMYPAGYGRQLSEAQPDPLREITRHKRAPRCRGDTRPGASDRPSPRGLLVCRGGPMPC